MDVHVDPLEPAPRLYIIGAGHVGWHLARLAREMDFRVHVVDDREKFANASAFPAPTRSSSNRIAEWLHRADIPRIAYVVIVTRGHQNDLEAMRALAARDLRYLGLIGSRAKVARISTRSSDEGMPTECLERVHAPIGLDIGAVTPQEIAVSILAELIAVRRGVDDGAPAASLQSLMHIRIRRVRLKPRRSSGHVASILAPCTTR